MLQKIAMMALTATERSEPDGECQRQQETEDRHAFEGARVGEDQECRCGVEKRRCHAKASDGVGIVREF